MPSNIIQLPWNKLFIAVESPFLEPLRETQLVLEVGSMRDQGSEKDFN